MEFLILYLGLLLLRTQVGPFGSCVRRIDFLHVLVRVPMAARLFDHPALEGTLPVGRRDLKFKNQNFFVELVK